MSGSCTHETDVSPNALQHLRCVRRGQDAAHALPSFLPLPFYEYRDLQPERLGVTQHHEAAAHQRHARGCTHQRHGRQLRFNLEATSELKKFMMHDARANLIRLGLVDRGEAGRGRKHARGCCFCGKHCSCCCCCRRRLDGRPRSSQVLHRASNHGGALRLQSESTLILKTNQNGRTMAAAEVEYLDYTRRAPAICFLGRLQLQLLCFNVREGNLAQLHNVLHAVRVLSVGI